MMATEQAHAKLTLYLHLLGKRAADGYHLLDALVVFTDLADTLAVTETSGELNLRIHGEFASDIAAQPPSSNLVLRAATLMQAHFNVRSGAALQLTKRIPVAAGLGGGSADAAAALRLLNRLWKINAPLDTLAPLAASLGSDVPACLYSQPLRMQGVGEIINPLAPQHHPNGTLLLINPRKSLLTRDVFAACRPPEPTQIPAADLPDWQSARNDLEQAAIEICPDIAEILQWLSAQEGCKAARLCGSGATCFGWFEKATMAQHASERLAAQKPHWWHSVTALMA